MTKFEVTDDKNGTARKKFLEKMQYQYETKQRCPFLVVNVSELRQQDEKHTFEVEVA